MTRVVTVSGSNGFPGPLPAVRAAVEEHGMQPVPVTFDGDVADEYSERWDDVRTAAADGPVALLAGFSAGAHLVLDLVQDVPSLLPRDATVVAFDPPDVMRTGNGNSAVSPVHSVSQDCIAVYPSVRDEENRVDGSIRIRDITYDQFSYTDRDPSDHQYRKMDRAHRFQDRDEAIRALIEEEIAAVNPHQATDGTPGQEM